MDMNGRVYIQHEAFCLSSSFWLRCPLFILGTPIIVTENIVFHVQLGWREAGGDSEGERGGEKENDPEGKEMEISQGSFRPLKFPLRY